MTIFLGSDRTFMSHAKGFAHTMKPSLYPVTGSMSGSTISPEASQPGAKEKAHNNFEIAINRLRSARWDAWANPSTAAIAVVISRFKVDSRGQLRS